MLEDVKKILAKQLRKEESEICAESRIKEDLGADSIDIMQLLMTIEETYNVTVPDEKLMDFKTVADVVSYLETLK